MNEPNAAAQDPASAAPGDAASSTAVAAGKGKGKRQAAMGFIMLTVLIDMISIGLIIPVLPQFVRELLPPGTSAGAMATATVSAYAIVAMAFAFANFVGSPILGALSDRYGRRPVLLMGFTGLAVSFFVTAMATQLWMLVAVRLFSGAVQSNAAIANAYVADITPPAERGKRYGMLGAMFGLGFILGPVMGGILGGKFGIRTPFLVSGVLAVCNGLYGLFVLPESLPPERRRPFSWARANPVGSILHLFELRSIGVLLFVIAFASLAQYILQVTWALYTQIKFGWGPEQVGWSLCAVGVMSVFTQGALTGRLTKRFGPERVATMGLVSSAFCFVAWGAVPQGWMMYIAIVANVLGFAAAPSVQAVIANAADPKTQGQTMGAVSGVTSLMMVLAPVVGPLLLRDVAHLPHGDWRMGAPYYLCAVLQAVAATLAIVHFGRVRRAAAHAASPAPAGH